MAGEVAVPLIIAGPFLGIDNTVTDIYTSPTKGQQMVNGTCEFIPKSLTAERGRLNVYAADSSTPGIPVFGVGPLISSGFAHLIVRRPIH